MDVSVCDDSWEFLGLVDHGLNLSDGRDNLCKVLGLVYFLHLSDEIGSDTVRELLHGVHARSFKKLGELRASALDAEKVSMVHPCKDKLSGDAGSLLKRLAALGRCTLLQKLVDGLYAGSDKLLSIDIAYALNVMNLVSHF